MPTPACTPGQGWGYNEPCSSCNVVASSVRLLYWPVTVSDQDACGGGSTAPPIGPSTAVFEGVTVTSPTVYLSFDVLAAGTAHYGHLTACGATHTNVLLPVEPTAISSFRGQLAPFGDLERWDIYDDWVTTYPVNFADFNYRTLSNNMSYPLVPKDAYQGQNTCRSNNKVVGCSTINQDYIPMIAFQDMSYEFLKVDANWGNCSWDLLAVSDPPIPLTTAQALLPTPVSTAAEVTSTELSTSNPASPGTTASPDIGTKTSYAVSTDPTPTSTADSVASDPTGASQPESSSATDLAGVIASIVASQSSADSTSQSSEPGAPSTPTISSTASLEAASDPTASSSTSSSGRSDAGPGSNIGQTDPEAPSDQFSSTSTADDPESIHTGVAVVTNSASQQISIVPIVGSTGLFSVVGQDIPATTISAGGAAATAGDVEVSVPASGDGANVVARPTGDSQTWSTVAVFSSADSTPLVTHAVVTLPGLAEPVTASAVASGVFVIPMSGASEKVTFTANGEATAINGVAVSAGDSIIKVGSSTVSLSTAAIETGLVLTKSNFPGSASEITAIMVSTGVFVLLAAKGQSSTTISIGGTGVTVDNAVVSAVETGLVEIVGSTTKATLTADRTMLVPTSEATGLGGYIISGLGGGTDSQDSGTEGPSANSTSTGDLFDGAGARAESMASFSLAVAIVVALVLM